MEPSATSRRAADLLAVLQIARQLGAITDLDAVLDLVVTGAARILGAERGSLFLYEPATHELVSRVAMGATTLRLPADRGIVGAVVRTREVVHVSDAYEDPRFNPEVDRRTGFRTRNILAVPLTNHEDGLVGVLQVLNKQGDDFDAEDEFIASVLAAQAGVALHRAQLMEALWDKKRMERDLDIARAIQRSYLPKHNPVLRGFDVAGWNRPADETGGDCYDFHPLPDGRLCVLLADATGHGIGPALMISECRALVRLLAGLYGADVGRILGHVNHVLEGDLPPGHFVTALLGVLEPDAARLVYHSAGQAPLLVYRRALDELLWLGADGMPLGIMEGAGFVIGEPLSFAPGDLFVAITDGFFEWSNEGGEQFGTARLGELVRRHRDAPAADLIDALRAGVEAWCGATRQADDLTAVVIKKL